MRIIGKNNDEILLLSLQEEVSKGDYLLIEDGNYDRMLILQVYDEEYHSTQSLLDDIMKDEIISATSKCNHYDPLGISSMVRIVRDARIVRCKIRASIDAGKISSNISWLPSRVNSRIRKVSVSELNSTSKRGV
jgi:hypothetical protein